MNEKFRISFNVTSDWASELQMEASHRGMTMEHYMEHIIRYRHQLPEMTLRLHPEQFASQERVADALEQMVVSFNTQMKLLERSVLMNEEMARMVTKDTDMQRAQDINALAMELNFPKEVEELPFIDKPWYRMSPHSQNLMRDLYGRGDEFYTDDVDMDQLAEKHHVVKWMNLFWRLESSGLIRIKRIKKKHPNLRWRVTFTFRTNDFTQC